MDILFIKHNTFLSIFDLKKYYQTQKYTYFTFKEILTPKVPQIKYKN